MKSIRTGLRPLACAAFLLAGLAAVFAAPGRTAASSPIAFQTPVGYTVSTAGTLATADVDGDGYPDVVAASLNGVSVLYGRGDGTFENAVEYPIHPGDASGVVTTADMDGDGRTDIVVGDAAMNRVVILMNQGNRQFVIPTTYQQAWAPQAVAAGDFNRDGKPDLAVVDQYNNRVAVYLNDGHGGLMRTPAYYPAGSFASSVAVGDLDHDGNLDMAVANYTDGSVGGVTIYLGSPSGKFRRVGHYRTRNETARVAIADFNRDGHPDLACANTFDNSISILYNDGTGHFAQEIPYPANQYPHLLSVGDFDGDGYPDIVTPNNGTNYCSILRNHGDTTFEDAFTLATPGTDIRVSAVGDFNRDGKPDFVVSSYQSSAVYAFINDGSYLAVPPAPTGLQVTAVSSTELGLSWRDNSSNEAEFEIQERKGGKFVPVATAPASDGTTSSATISGLKPHSTHTYRVVAANATGSSAPSNKAHGTTLRAPHG